MRNQTLYDNITQQIQAEQANPNLPKLTTRTNPWTSQSSCSRAMQDLGMNPYHLSTVSISSVAKNQH